MALNQPAAQVFAANAKLLRARASKHALIGTAIAVVTVIIVTIVATYLPDGDEITYANMLAEQKSNQMLWFVDAMPFLFAFGGSTRVP